MTDRSSDQYDPIISEINSLYISFSKDIGEYLKTFTEDMLLAFSFSENEAKIILKSHYLFAASAVKFLERSDIPVAKLTGFLYSAYNENDQETVAKIGKIISRQFDCKGIISSFIGSCEDVIKSSGQKISAQALYKESTIFKQKFDTLLN